MAVDWTHTVEVARGVPIGTVPDPADWDDVLGEVDSVRVSRFDVVSSDTGSAGSATFTFIDEDRSYDPETDSDLTMGLPIRWRVTYNAVTYDVWYGYCESFQLVDNNQGTTTVIVTASTALSWLPAEVGSLYEFEAENNGGADGIWLFEFEGQSFPDFTGTAGGTWVNEPAVTSGGLLGAESGFTTFDGEQYGRVGSFLQPSALPLGVEWSCRLASDITDGTYEMVAMFDGTNSFVAQVAVTVASDSAVVTCWSSLKSASNGVSVTLSLEDLQRSGSAALFGYRATSGAEQFVYNGTAQSTSSVSAPSAPTQTGLWFGGGSGGGRLNFEGAMSLVGVYRNDPGEANLTDRFDAMSGRVGQKTFTRAGLLLDMAAWPSALEDLDSTGLVGCGAFDHAGRGFAAELGVLAATENGALFVSGDGKITTHDRLFYATDAGSVSWTFSDDGSDLRYSGLTREYDWKDVIGSATASSRTSGEEASASAAPAVTNRSLSVSTVAGSVAELETLAQTKIDRLGSAEVRVPTLTVKPSRDEANLFPAVLGAEIGDRVKVERTPQGSGGQWSKEFVIVGVSHSVSPQVWGATVFDLEPVPAASTAYYDPGVSVAGTSTLLAP